MVQICLVNALFPPDKFGGAENYVLRATKTLQKQGHDVAVITSKPYDGLSSLRPSKDSYEGIPVWRFYPLNLRHLSDGTGDNIIEKVLWRQIDLLNVLASTAAGWILDRLDPDVVHTNNLFGISTLVGRAIQHRDIRHVHTLHDYGLICPKSSLIREWTAPDDEIVICEEPPIPCRIYAKQREMTLGDPDLVTAPSQHVLNIHNEHGFFNRVETQRLQLGIDGVAERPPPRKDQAILYVGKQLEKKGIETLFAAADRLPDVSFHVCGTGPYEERTEAVAAERDNLQYHGFASEEHLVELRRTAAAAIVPSIWMENSPMTIYESYAIGLPVIGSNIGGIPELIDPGETGFLFEPENEDDLAATIRRLFEDSDQRTLQKNALAWARQHTMTAHVERLLNEVYQL